MSKTFCVMPFNHLHLDPDGGVRICCIATESIHQDGRPVSLYTHRVSDIWRSDYMRDVRRAMLDGVPLQVCEKCYQYEKLGAQSFRQIFNAGCNYTSFPPSYFDQAVNVEHGAAAAEVASEPAPILDSDLVDGSPRWYQILLGNYCNLKCRMCVSDLSSSIESDPVHSLWTPSWNSSLPFWKRDVVSIGPKPSIGVQYKGFGPLDFKNGLPVSWTTGDTVLDLPWDGESRLKSIEIELWDGALPEADVLVEINDLRYPVVKTGPGINSIAMELSGQELGNNLTIRIKSQAWELDGSGRARMVPVHLPIRDVRLIREKSTKAKRTRQALGGRFSGDGYWYEQASLLYGELLKEPDRLVKIKITGGEPLLSPYTEQMLEYLIDSGTAGRITLDLTTNCTTVTNTIIEKLRRFHRVELGLSIDGLKLDNEYIRHPTKWEAISENVKVLKTLENAYFQVQPTIQIYNILRISELLKWCDDLDMRFYPQILFDPLHLSLEIAPAEARRRAATRVENIVPKLARADNRESATNLIGVLAGGAASTPHDDSAALSRNELLHRFMLFTNDLDRSRNQSLLDANPELVELLEAEGHPWIGETLYYRERKAVAV